jgi:hypothetical protein
VGGWGVITGCGGELGRKTDSEGVWNSRELKLNEENEA